MENSKLKRINELAAIAKQRELTKEEFESGATYISLMEQNLANLQEALY